MATGFAFVPLLGLPLIDDEVVFLCFDSPLSTDCRTDPFLVSLALSRLLEASTFGGSYASAGAGSFIVELVTGASATEAVAGALFSVSIIKFNNYRIMGNKDSTAVRASENVPLLHLGVSVAHLS